MTKELSGASKRNKIANYMASLPEEFEVIEDNLIEATPTIELQTKSRIIKLSCDERGKVAEEFTMREGAGSKEDFLLKQEAYNAIRDYYNDYYTGAKIKKSSFEEGMLKLELADRIVTLTYDPNEKIVEEQDRAKRKPKPKEEQTQDGQMSLFDLGAKPPSNVSEKPKEEALDDEASNAADSLEPSEETEYKRLLEGAAVINICNNKEYKVKRDLGNVIEVFDKDYGYLMMARADLKI